IPTDAGNRDGVQWIAADAVHTPAQLWNLAMAATHADAVLLLAPGARLAQPLRIPACTADPSVVLGQPRCRRGDAIELGWQGDDLLHLAALPAPLATVPVEVPFACPQAFVVRRPAFVTVGLFDEAVLGELALAEYALRAQARGFRVLGIPELEVQLPVEAHGSSDPHVDRDRLLVLAAHRPAVLGTALAHDHALWQLDRAAVPAFLAELFGRLPAAEGGREARDLLACIAVAMVEHATPGARIDAVLRQRRRQLLAALAPAEAAPTPKVDPATSTITDVPAALADVFELERRLAAVAEGDLARSRGERDALAVQLTQTRSERDEVAAQLAQSRTELASTQQRVGVLEREFEMIAQAIGMVGRPEIEEVHGRLRRLHDDAEQLARTIAAAGAPDPAGLIDELEAIRAQLADSRKLLAERNQWIALLLREVTRRRLLARKLLEHEQAFLAQMGRAP
ncbi:MAG TPA: hypothetical protein VK348_10685, partial [Planctomycetota bacterium]|nr:hypothetical protein [Planctomycetota bacterium]